MINIKSGLNFRPGKLEDLPQVRQICAEVWDGNDYVPHIWSHFVEQPENQTFIVEVNQELAGLYCLRTGLAGPQTAWIQSVRVSGRFKRQGLAAAIIEHALRTSREQDLRVLRYVTAEDNVPMHRLAERYGFRHIMDFLNRRYEPALPVAAAPAWRYVTTAEFDEAYNMIIASEEYRLAEGFYCDRWWWKPLYINNLRQHLEKKQVYSLKGIMRALAIMTNEEEGGYWLAFLAGKPAAQQSLLASLERKVAADVPPGKPLELAGMFARTPATEETLRQAGFVPDAHEPVMSLYELLLDEK